VRELGVREREREQKWAGTTTGEWGVGELIPLLNCRVHRVSRQGR